MNVPKIRKGQGDVALSREEFARRLRERFYDPAFDRLPGELDRLVDTAWTTYHDYHKSPRTRKAGPGFANPDFELPIEWLEARSRILEAAREHDDPNGRSRILVVCGAARHDQTCPGEMSKTFRLAQLAREEIERANIACDLLDLSLLTAEYGRQILPCKACVSTAMPLCHWPCSCYPNHAMGQVNDWMNEIYPRWVAAHGIIIVSLTDWLTDMSLVPAAPNALVDRYVGYYEPYATSHEALDRDTSFQEEVRNAARALVEGVRLLRAGAFPRADRGQRDPRSK